MLKEDIKKYVSSIERPSGTDGCICGKCKSINNYEVVDSRYKNGKGRVRTKRCLNCNHKWKTLEICF